MSTTSKGKSKLFEILRSFYSLLSPLLYGMTECLVRNGVPMTDCDKKPDSAGMVFPGHQMKVRLHSTPPPDLHVHEVVLHNHNSIGSTWPRGVGMDLFRWRRLSVGHQLTASKWGFLWHVVNIPSDKVELRSIQCNTRSVKIKIR